MNATFALELTPPAIAIDLTGVASLEADAVQHRPDVVMARQQEQLAAAAVDAALAAFLPQVVVQGNWELNGRTWNSRSSSWVAGAVARINLFHGGADKARVAEAREQVARRALERDKAETLARRTAVAAQIKAVFEQTGGVVDTDWLVEAPHAKIALAVDGQKAAAAVVRMAGSGESVGLLHDERAREDVPIVIRLPRDARSLEAVQAIRLRGVRPVAVGELASAVTTPETASLYRKNLQAVTYVTGDLAGEKGSPAYVIFQMNKAIARMSLPEGYGLEVFNSVQPFDTSRYAMKWDGEWQLTIEVFRDLGLAFAAVLLLIYVLVVGWFQSLKAPLVIMAAIPFSLVGILPAHAAMGAFFTATSMIGFIAGAGIVVRNSIILVDFIELRLREGLPLEQAVVDAGAVRFRPMAFTAAAMIVGAAVILFDPIFQGLAISLMAGEAAALLLSRMAVPVLYYMAMRGGRVEPAVAAAEMKAVA